MNNPSLKWRYISFLCETRYCKPWGITMRVKHRYVTVVVACVLLAASISGLTVEPAWAQEKSYFASVKPTVSTIYLNAGQICNISFEALSSYGDNAGQVIEYANMGVEVKTADGAVTNMMVANTSATGFADFNYSSATPQVLTFTPIILITQVGIELNSSLIQNDGVYGLQAKSLTVYWDTFDVAMVRRSTDIFEAAQISVNVTYLLVPEEGLTIHAADGSQEFFPKIAHGVNVTVNGVQAEETTVAGVYSANVSILMPTAYVLVEVSQDGWVTANKAFSFTHNANMSIWEPLAAVFATTFAVAFAAVMFSLRKSKSFVTKLNYLPVFAGFLLTLVSFLGLYWVLIWFEGTSHGFAWTAYWIFGVPSFVFGVLGGVFAVHRQKQTAVLFAISVSIFMNIAVVKASLDTYQLATPWALLIAILLFSATSGLLIGNSDNQFKS